MSAGPVVVTATRVPDLSRRAYQAGWHARRTRLLAYGRWEPLQLRDPARVRVRVDELRAAHGLCVEGIAELAGVSSSVIAGLVFERGAGFRTRGVHPVTEERILAARFNLDRLSEYRRVSAVGTRRRIEALAWVGWSGQQLAAELGVSRTAVAAHRHRDVVLVSTARAVRDLYQAWGLREGPSPKARATARRRGYVPAAAWDDDDLDDLRGRPHLSQGAARAEVVDDVAVARACAGDISPVGLTRAERLVAFRRLAATGLSDQAIGERVGWAARTVLRHRHAEGLGSRWAS